MKGSNVGMADVICVLLFWLFGRLLVCRPSVCPSVCLSGRLSVYFSLLLCVI